MYIAIYILIGIDGREDPGSEKAQSLILPSLSFPQFLELSQSHADDLVHVVVAVGGEAADE